MASVHCAAATANFLACENHSLDVPFWSDLVAGIDKPIIDKGWIKVPDKPGLGITLNDEVCKQHLRPNTGYFDPTPEWNTERSGDWLWSFVQKEEAGRRKRNPRDIPTLRRYVDEFSRLRPLRPSTEKTHAYMLARWILPELGELPLHKITSAQLMEFRTKLLLEKKSPSTANRHISLVRKLLNEARIRGLIETHPAPALLLHGGLIATAVLLWRDPATRARLSEIIARRRADARARG